MRRARLSPESVTEAAAVIVDAEGQRSLTLARLAADLGVAPPSLYKHVAGLDDLLDRVTALSIQQLTDDLMASVLGRSRRQALAGFAEAYRRFAVGHPGLYSLAQSRIDLHSTTQQANVLRSAEVLGAAIEGYGMPDELAVHAMRMVRATVHGFADIEVHGGFQMPHSVDESFLLLIEALDTSLSKLGRRGKMRLAANTVV